MVACDGQASEESRFGSGLQRLGELLYPGLRQIIQTLIQLTAATLTLRVPFTCYPAEALLRGNA
jgi:hypothetical protein